MVIFCFGGRGWCEFAGKRFDIETGHFFILPPNQAHSYGSNGFWKKGWIHFSGEISQHVVKKLLGDSFGQGIPFALPKEWFSRFNQMIDELSLDSSFANVAFNCSKLWPSFAELIYPQRGLFQVSDPIERALSYIESNVKEFLSLESMAAASLLSVSRFCVLFKERTGQSAKEYHLQLKIQYACRLLTMTDWSVKDIAAELSFDDPYYFSRCFKKRMGVSPKHYRIAKAD